MNYELFRTFAAKLFRKTQETMANNLRFQVVEEAFKKRAIEVKAPAERPSEYFGKYVFSREKMYKYLTKDIYDKMIDVMDNGARLDRSIADAVAAGTGTLQLAVTDDLGLHGGILQQVLRARAGHHHLLQAVRAPYMPRLGTYANSQQPKAKGHNLFFHHQKILFRTAYSCTGVFLFSWQA